MAGPIKNMEISPIFWWLLWNFFFGSPTKPLLNAELLILTLNFPLSVAPYLQRYPMFQTEPAYPLYSLLHWGLVIILIDQVLMTLSGVTDSFWSPFKSLPIPLHMKYYHQVDFHKEHLVIIPKSLVVIYIK